MARLLAHLTLWAALAFSAVAAAQTIPNLPAATQGSATDLYACSQGPGTSTGNTTRKCTPSLITQGAYLNLPPLNMVSAGLDNTGSVDNSATLQAIVNANTAGNCLYFPAGTYLFHGITSANPICVIGVGNGAGPGPAAQANSYVTQFMMNSSTSDLFTVTSNFPSYFRDFQVNVLPSYRPMTSGTGIHLIGAVGENVANYFIHGIGFTNIYQPIHVLRPAWGVIENCYFDTWYNSGIYFDTTTGVEGSGGDIEHNWFFGFTSTTTPPIYSGVGYTNIHNNEILGGNYGIEFNIANYSAGFIKIHDNTIENFSNACVGVLSADGNIAAMVMIQHNECSTYTVNVTAGIVVAEYPSNPSWVSDVLIQGNISRSTSATGGKHYWVQAGKNVVIEGNLADELSTNSNITAYQITGVTTNTGLAPPFIVSNNVYMGTIATPYNFISNAGVASTGQLDTSNNLHQQVPTGSVFDWDVAGTTKLSLSASGLSSTGSVTSAANIAGGSAPTLTGSCTTSTQTGGNTSGTFKATCTAQTVIITFATTAPNNWVCVANDITTSADTLKQTASSTTSCTLTGTTVANDVIGFFAQAS